MTYRDSQAALEERRDALEKQLFEVRAQKLALEEITQREKAIEQELDAARSMLTKGKRSPLDTVFIASPCSESWEDMEGVGKVRFCGKCQKNVYSLAAMSREEAEDLLRANDAPCLRIFRRADGTVMTSDCPARANEKRRRRRLTLAVVGLGVIGAGALVALSMAGRSVQSGSVGALRQDVF